MNWKHALSSSCNNTGKNSFIWILELEKMTFNEHYLDFVYRGRFACPPACRWYSVSGSSIPFGSYKSIGPRFVYFLLVRGFRDSIRRDILWFEAPPNNIRVTCSKVIGLVDSEREVFTYSMFLGNINLNDLLFKPYRQLFYWI